MSAKFKILLGPSMSGKTHKLAEWVLDEARKHPEKNYIVVVPEQSGNAYEKKLIDMNNEKYGRPGFMNIDVLGFSRLAFRVFEVMGIKDTSVLEEYEKNMLVRVVAGKLAKELKVYSGSVDRTGFISEVKSLLSELIQYNVTPEDLAAVIEGLKENEGSGLIAKLEDISKLYAGFNEVLDNMETGISEERLKLLTKLLRSDKACKITDGTVFVFDEYRGYTPDQLAVIGALRGRAELLYFGICMDAKWAKDKQPVKEHDIFHQSYTTIVGLQKAIGFEPELEVLEKSSNVSGFQAASDELTFLRDNVFRYPIKEYSGELKGSLEVYKARNPEAEMRIVAEQIRKEVKSGLRYKDIYIMTGDIEAFDRNAGRLFEEYDIPIFCDFNRKLRKNPYTEAIINALNIADKDFDYDSVFGFAKTGVLGIEDTYALDNLENHILKTGIRGSKLWHRELRPYGSKPSDEEKSRVARMEEVRKIIVGAAEPIAELSSGKHEVREFVQAIKTIIVNLNFKDKMEESGALLSDQGRYADARVALGLLNTIEKMLDQTEDLLGNQEMSIHDFSEMLVSGISDITLGVIPPTLDAVHVCDPNRSRILDAKVVHFINVNDGIVPTPRAVGKLLSDKDKTKIAAMLEKLDTGKYLSDSQVQQSIDELFMIYQLLSKPTEKLTLSYTVSDEEGNGLEPSFIIGRILRMFPGLKVELRDVTPFGGTMKSDKQEFIGWIREMIDNIHATKNGNNKQYKDTLELVVKYLEFTDGLVIPSEIKPGLTFENKAVPISSEIMDRINLRLSVSKMERYASCPYSYMMQYVLGLKERPEKKIEFFDVGNILHRALELTVTEVAGVYENDWVNIGNDKLTEMMRSNVQSSWEEYDMSKGQDLPQSGKESMIYDHLTSLSDRTILTIRDHIIAGEMLPERMEQSFRAEFSATKPDGSEMPIVITGKIDRIDTHEEGDNLYFRVVDYKTGSNDFNATEVREGTAIQLSVYTKIIEEILKKRYKDRQIIPAGMYYYHVDDPIVSPYADSTIARDYDGDVEAALKAKADAELKLRGVSNMDPNGEGDDYPHRNLNLHDKLLVSHDTGMIINKSKVIPVSADKEGVMTDSAVVIDTAGLENICDYSAQAMKSTAESILQGCFDKSPIMYGHKQGNACEYCSFKSVCRFNENAGAYKMIPKAKSSVRQQLEELSEIGANGAKVNLSKESFFNSEG